MKKSDKRRVFSQMDTKRKLRKVEKAEDLGKLPVSRAELYNIQNTMSVRTDAALMGVAALAQILVDKKMSSYDEFKNGEKGMQDTLRFIRLSMAEGYRTLGKKTKPEDIGTFIYEKAIVFGVDKDILTSIFGVRPSESRILTPGQVKPLVTIK